MKVPPCLRAKSQLKSAVRAPPTWRKPVGDGAKRVLTLMVVSCLSFLEQLRRCDFCRLGEGSAGAAARKDAGSFSGLLRVILSHCVGFLAASRGVVAKHSNRAAGAGDLGAVETLRWAEAAD